MCQAPLDMLEEKCVSAFRYVGRKNVSSPLDMLEEKCVSAFRLCWKKKCVSAFRYVGRRVCQRL